jgi:hypothetical protein
MSARRYTTISSVYWQLHVQVSTSLRTKWIRLELLMWVTRASNSPIPPTQVSRFYLGRFQAPDLTFESEKVRLKRSRVFFILDLTRTPQANRTMLVQYQDLMYGEFLLCSRPFKPANKPLNFPGTLTATQVSLVLEKRLSWRLWFSGKNQVHRNMYLEIPSAIEQHGHVALHTRISAAVVSKVLACLIQPSPRPCG